MFSEKKCIAEMIRRDEALRSELLGAISDQTGVYRTLVTQINATAAERPAAANGMPLDIQAQIVRDATIAAMNAVATGASHPSKVAADVARAGVIAWRTTQVDR